MNKLNLMLHTGARAVERPQLALVATPPRTSTWQDAVACPTVERYLRYHTGPGRGPGEHPQLTTVPGQTLSQAGQPVTRLVRRARSPP